MSAETTHVCELVYLDEGEYVCFDCGAVYIYACQKYDAETLNECRALIAARSPSRTEREQDD